MLGLDNPIHLLFVGVLLLLVFGAKRLPEMGHSLGAGLRGFKHSLTAEEPSASIAESAAALRVEAAAPVVVSPVVVSAVDERGQPVPARPVV